MSNLEIGIKGFVFGIFVFLFIKYWLFGGKL